MRLTPRSPSEFFIKYLLSKADEEANEQLIMDQLDRLGLDGLNLNYIRRVQEEMGPRPDPFLPEDPTHMPSRRWLKGLKIFDMWAQTPSTKEAFVILQDAYVQEKLRPLLLSSMHPAVIAKRLRKYTSIPLTRDGVTAYRHYFWNRMLMTQGQWMEYFNDQAGSNVLAQGLLTPTDLVPKHLPWVVGISGPSAGFNMVEAAARIGQIAVKHAIELENVRCSVDTSMALKNCMTTLEKANAILRQSDVALQDVLRQFQQFRMKMDRTKIIEIQALTPQGNYSKSGEGTDVDDEDF
jgi:hypothetical protein